LSSNPIRAIFDPVFFLTFFNMIILFILKIIGKSTTALNHVNLLHFLTFLNKFCKAAIFVFTTRAYFIHFQMMMPESYGVTLEEAIQLILKDREQAQNLFLDVLYSDLKLVGFLLSIVLSISSVLYVLSAFLRIIVHLIVTYWLYCFMASIPLINLIYFIKKIRSDEGILFRHYRLREDGNMVIVEHRKIYPHVFREETVLKRILLNFPFLVYSIVYDAFIAIAIVMLCTYSR
ncbi:MAG: hypothetical protein K2K50_07975, partial [Anaeroplasmataceae bacterium]|nr:hypothetical protein [Anaeroplasmataceae bacterium]